MGARDQQVRAVYRAVLERPAAERASFIAELTGDDLELRRSVELLLSSQDVTDVGGQSAAETERGPELAAGSIVDQYRIEGVLGRGGVGVVYHASDTKLQRPVAIKFLAAAVADGELRRRFEQEAATTAALHHPHIVAVYDIGEHAGRQYVVSELIEGGTLDEWAGARRPTWRQSVELLVGVADALAAAHAAGVLHRDVKPGNVLVDGNGYAKLADFGLAKLVGRSGSAPAAPGRSRETRAGVIVGTVAYMSPEQATGQPLDARSDIFSFGVVLYELLAGRPPFAAANELETLKSIAHASPPPLPETIPEPLRALLDKALEKAPGDRYQTMQDLVVDLRRLARGQASAQIASTVAMQRRRTRAWAVATTGLAVALLAALVPATAYFLQRPPSAAPQIRFDVAAPGLAANGLAVSPDGTRIAYPARVDGVRRIWIRPLDSLEARAIAGTEGAQGVFWSPDNRHLAFVADSKLKSIDIAGGPAVTVADYDPVLWFAGAWRSDGTILASAADYDIGGLAIGRVPAVGGTWTIVNSPGLASGGTAYFAPRSLPGSDHFLFVATVAGTTTASIHVGTVRDGTSVPLVEGADSPSVADGSPASLGFAAGHVLYKRTGVLVAQRLDTEALTLVGEAVPIAENVAEFAVTDRTLVYRAATTTAAFAATRELVWHDRSGQRVGAIEVPFLSRLPVLSPDGRQIALSVGSIARSDVWTLDTQRGTSTRLTSNDANDDVAAWSPDGTRIAFNSGRDGAGGTPSSLYVRNANGTGTEERLLAFGLDELIIPFDWSRDGRHLLLGRAGIAGWRERVDIWALELTGERTAFPLIESPFRKESAKFSPDGRWIAYTSNEANGPQVFVQPFPDISRGKWHISTRGGREPRWRGDGRELYYIDPDGVIMSVDMILDGERFEPGQPRPLFDTGLAMPSADLPPDVLYEVTGDGERFLINRAAPDFGALQQGAAQTPGVFTVIVNWAANLERP